VPMALRRFDTRHRRAKDSVRRRRLTGARTDDDEPAVVAGLAWA
jgi:hypothetical protein